MNREEVKEVIACLGNERKVFHYFKDRYCLDLIAYEMDRKNNSALKISELKSGNLCRVLQKQIVSQALKHFGNGYICKRDLQMFWPNELLSFVSTIGCWGNGDRGRDQTSRNQCNLVLQLNFDTCHINEYKRLVKPVDDYGPFEYWGHPVCRQQRKTMSWIRMDIDFDCNEVLIEEIQNDWIRKAGNALTRVKNSRVRLPTIKPSQVISDIGAEYEDLQHYVEQTLQPYRKIWAEASMVAAIEFIREVLGITTVYYHSFDTGMKIKSIYGAPPRSMYIKLPKQFGFELTEQQPEFLMQDKTSRRYINAIKDPRWFRLEV